MPVVGLFLGPLAGVIVGALVRSPAEKAAARPLLELEEIANTLLP